MFFVTFSSAEQIDLYFSSLLLVLEDNYNGLFIDVSLVTSAVLSVLSVNLHCLQCLISRLIICEIIWFCFTSRTRREAERK